jgi:hypothetical protein
VAQCIINNVLNIAKILEHNVLLHSSNSINMVKFSTYLFRNGMDCLSRAILVPWILIYLNYCIDTSWIQAVLAYGLFYSSIHLGLICGTAIGNDADSSEVRVIALIIIALSFGGLAMTTRILLLLGFAFVIGVACALLNDADNGHRITTNHPPFKHMSIASMNVGSASNTADRLAEMNAQRRIGVFAFTVLFSGMIWREDKITLSASLKVPGLIMLAMYLFVAIMKSVVNKKPVKQVTRSRVAANDSGDALTSGPVSSTRTPNEENDVKPVSPRNSRDSSANESVMQWMQTKLPSFGSVSTPSRSPSLTPAKPKKAAYLGEKNM